MVQAVTENKTHLTAIRGGKFDDSVGKLAGAAWAIARSLLFSHLSLSSDEVTACITVIRQRLSVWNTGAEGFINLIQRVASFRLHSSSETKQPGLLPSDWFRHGNAAGFALSAPLMEEITRIRASIPGYRSDLKALAEALLEMSEEPTVRNFIYWRDWFSERGMQQAHDLFCIAVTYLQLNP